MVPKPASCLFSGGQGTKIYHGDCRIVLVGLQEASIDAIVTDPPYGLHFMGKAWDYDVPGVEVWRECLRVLKPGGHLLAFFGTRTYHRGVCAVEDAGFEIRDKIDWLYGSGFPKSRNLGGEWQGWGTALKPACEPIVLARKPLVGTVAANVLVHGTGALNIDGCRVEYQDAADRASATPQGRCTARSGALAGSAQYAGCDDYAPDALNPDPADRDICTTCLYRASEHRPRVEFVRPDLKGRWPANVIHDGSEEVSRVFPPELGATSGSPARFFYCAKASRAERGPGNDHPTVKPLALMRYLCRLVTPPNGVVLDPFMGSGSTLLAARAEGFSAIGVEIEERSCEIAVQRLGGGSEKHAA